MIKSDRKKIILIVSAALAIPLVAFLAIFLVMAWAWGHFR
jgi:hypothetical protein